MVRQGVNLVSRLGSSECGCKYFQLLPAICSSYLRHISEVLMSSHRDYDKDLEWSWLRNDGLGLRLLHFEPVVDSEDMFELVVSESWPTKVC